MSLLKDVKLKGLKAKHDAQVAAAEEIRDKAEKGDEVKAKIIKKRSKKN